MDTAYWIVVDKQEIINDGTSEKALEQVFYSL